MEQVIKANKGYLRLITGISVVVPLLVGFLLYNPFASDFSTGWVMALPRVNAVINSLTAALLILAFVAIKRKRIILHRNLMLTALMLGAIFLISYVVYHSAAESTVYGDANHDGVLDAAEKTAMGSMRAVYLFVLLSHIGLSIVVVPFVLLAFYFALSGQIGRHKKLVKYTYPIWLYVSVSGVLVYLLISPYYF